MAFRLDAQQTVHDSLLATVDGELEDAIASLSVTDPARRPEAVHDARKRIKKARSALRMVRGALGKRTARELNDELRAIAASLSDRRDADVLVETVDALHERFAGQIPAATFEALRARLSEQAASEGDGDTSGQVVRLELVRERLAAADVGDVRWSTVGTGLERAYRRGRKGYRAAARASTEELHQWRKRAKDLWYQNRLIQGASPEVLKAYAKDAHELSDLLGDDHDLAVLRATIVYQDPPAASAPVDLDPVVDLIDERRGELQAEARRVARRLYAESPKAFSKRTRAYLRAFADDAAASAEPVSRS
jgi:CHAD domain-containing protein